MSSDGRWQIEDGRSGLKVCLARAIRWSGEFAGLPVSIMAVKSFEELDVWQVARQIVADVYVLTRDSVMVKDFGLCGQLQRDAVSIMANIAEGFERTHLGEKLQFYNVARASTGEMRSLLYVVQDNYPAVAESAVVLRNDAVRVGKMLSGLIQSTYARKQRSSSPDLPSPISHLSNE